MRDSMKNPRSIKWSIALACFIAGISWGALAAAQTSTAGVMEFKMGPYLPDVDGEFGEGGEGPYQAFFGTSAMLNGEFQLDYHVWDGFGKLSVGGHLGYARVRGEVLTEDGEELGIGERAKFRIIPLRGSLIYRYDYSALHHRIPLVPVAKAGLNYNFWRVTTPDGDTAQANGVEASGGKAGWHASLGLHFHLNFIDPGSAAAFDLNWGINNSYLFAEYMWSRVGFGGEGINLSSDHWFVGLAFEF